MVIQREYIAENSEKHCNYTSHRKAISKCGRTYRHSWKIWCQSAGATGYAKGDEMLKYASETALDEADLIVVVGGDGSILKASQEARKRRIPLLGINTGHIGFLTELEVDEVEKYIRDIAEGNYEIEERILIKAQIHGKEEQSEVFYCLNDAVLSRGAAARLIYFDVYVDDSFAGQYPADGIVVATPTGSRPTLSLQAGRWWIPKVSCVLLTPVCPHMLSARPVVVGVRRKIKYGQRGRRRSPFQLAAS